MRICGKGTLVLAHAWSTGTVNDWSESAKFSENGVRIPYSARGLRMQQHALRMAISHSQLIFAELSSTHALTVPIQSRTHTRARAREGRFEIRRRPID